MRMRDLIRTSLTMTVAVLSAAGCVADNSDASGVVASEVETAVAAPTWCACLDGILAVCNTSPIEIDGSYWAMEWQLGESAANACQAVQHTGTGVEGQYQCFTTQVMWESDCIAPIVP